MSEMDTDPLHVLEPCRWPELVDLFSGEHGYTARVTIKAQIYNVDNTPDFPLRAYAPYGQPEEGIIFIWRLSMIGFEISIFSNKSDTTKLAKAIENTKHIDWNSRLLFCSMLPEVETMITTILENKKYSYNKDSTYVAKLPMEKALEFNAILPSDVRLEILGVEHAEEINNLWPHRYPGSLNYFEGMLGRGSAVGIIGKADGDLRGWVLRSVRGDLHSLHVKTEFRRNGYAQLLVKMLSKTIAERNSDVFGCIITENAPSKDLFIKLGFNLTVIVYWVDSWINKD